MSTEGGPAYIANDTQVFFSDMLGVTHRLSSAYHSQPNGRAVAAVKSTKHLFMLHWHDCGKINVEAVAAGLLHYHNTPNPETGLSPAQIFFSRSIQDLLPLATTTRVFYSSAVHQIWRRMWEQQEEAMHITIARHIGDLSPHSCQHPPLVVRDRVLLLNQTGTKPTQWDRSGTVVEVRPHGQHIVCMDDSPD